VLKLLERHPKVTNVVQSDSPELVFQAGEWRRTVSAGKPSEPLFGLVETIDNNPLVCADSMSVPDPASTLISIAICPLIQAGLLLEAPAVLLSFEPNIQLLSKSLKRVGLDGEVAVHAEDSDLGGVLAATVMAAIRTPEDLDEIDLLFEEQYGRAFYIRRDEESEWGPDLVRGLPYAVYRLRISPDEPTSILTISVLADQDGKCGAAQMVHAMNLMSGFEESLGIS
jgi:N-acetyl-gamma-glutamylphosphate reductase